MVGTVEQPYEPTTIEEKLDRKNEMKARGTLLMIIKHKSKSTKCDFCILQRTNSKSSTNEADNTAYGVSTTHTQCNIVNSTSVDNLSDAVIYAFPTSQPNSPQLAREDIEQIDPDDLEEMDLHWKMYMLTIRARSEYGRKTIPVENPTENALISQDGIGRATHSKRSTKKKELLTVVALGIKKEFSVVRTPQQNGVAKRKNRTLIEAAKTMLVDYKLPTTFWAEAVNIACYVLNRALVIKPHNKTPYDLIHGRPPLIDFMKPFRCPVIILNTKNYLGKFDENSNEGFFIGYSMVSKAMRVFNKRTRIVEETLNIRFLENTPNVKENRLDWLFDIDSLPISMKYVPVFAGFQTNGITGTKDNIVAGLKDNAVDAGKKDTEVDESQVSDNGRQDDQVTRSELQGILQQESAAGTLAGILGNAYDNDDVEEKVDMNNVVSSYTIPDALLIKFLKDHPKDQLIGSIETHVQTKQMTKLNEEHAMKPVQALKDPSWVEAM
nr:retrovirus-related Pol polyprotein from transposon TNT 1-94 [Tanacetum cinerariifolium]